MIRKRIQCLTRLALNARTLHEELPAFGDKFQNLVIRQWLALDPLTHRASRSEKHQGNYQTFEQASLPEHCVPSTISGATRSISRAIATAPTHRRHAGPHPQMRWKYETNLASGP